MRTFRLFPCTLKVIEYAAASNDRKVRVDIKELEIPSEHYFTIEDAEQCAQELDGQSVGSFIECGAADQDALEFVARDKSTDASRILHEFGDSGDALTSVIEDALEGSLQDFIFGSES